MTPETSPPALSDVRAIVLGAGMMGCWHADAAARAGARVWAVVDPQADRARALAARHVGARTAERLEHLEPAGVEVVHVCAPVAEHAALARLALQSGRHAVVEKPAGRDAAETEALLALAGRAGRILCPVHQYPFQRGAARLARSLPSLGPVLHVDATVCSAGADGWPDEERERLAGEILIHPLSLLARLPGLAIETAGWTVARPRPGELRAVAESGGATLSIVVSTAGRPTASGLRLVAARGTARLDLFHGFAVIEPGGVSRARKVVRPFALAGATTVRAGANLLGRAARREPAFPGLRELVAAVYRAVRKGGPPPLPESEILAVARARDAILAGRPAT